VNLVHQITCEHWATVPLPGMSRSHEGP
jgi:hypothetical protein